MSISFSASQSMLYAILKSDYDMREGEGCSTWPLSGPFGLPGSAPIKNWEKIEKSKVLATRAMHRFEREFESYLLWKSRPSNGSSTTLPVVRQYHRLFVECLDDLQVLFRG